MRNLAKFHQNTWKCHNWDFDGSLLSKVESKNMSLKFTGEFCVMTLEIDAKFEEELTCQFKSDMKHLTNFDPSTRNSQKSAL